MKCRRGFGPRVPEVGGGACGDEALLAASAASPTGATSRPAFVVTTHSPCVLLGRIPSEILS